MLKIVGLTEDKSGTVSKEDDSGEAVDSDGREFCKFWDDSLSDEGDGEDKAEMSSDSNEGADEEKNRPKNPLIKPIVCVQKLNTVYKKSHTGFTTKEDQNI